MSKEIAQLHTTEPYSGRKFKSNRDRKPEKIKEQDHTVTQTPVKMHTPIEKQMRAHAGSNMAQNKDVASENQAAPSRET